MIGGIISWFVGPGIPGMVYFFISLFISSIALYIIAIMLGKIGGMILAAIGLVGMVFSAGATLVLTILGVIMIFVGDNPKLIVLGNIALFVLCVLCSGF